MKEQTNTDAAGSALSSTALLGTSVIRPNWTNPAMKTQEEILECMEWEVLHPQPRGASRRKPPAENPTHQQESKAAASARTISGVDLGTSLSADVHDGHSALWQFENQGAASAPSVLAAEWTNRAVEILWQMLWQLSGGLLDRLRTARMRQSTKRWQRRAREASEHRRRLGVSLARRESCSPLRTASPKSPGSREVSLMPNRYY